jgi:hypothetical protein
MREFSTSLDETSLRLRRLMCGKPMAFRKLPLFRGYAPDRRGRSPKNERDSYRKVEDFPHIRRRSRKALSCAETHGVRTQGLQDEPANCRKPPTSYSIPPPLGSSFLLSFLKFVFGAQVAKGTNDGKKKSDINL